MKNKLLEFAETLQGASVEELTSRLRQPKNNPAESVGMSTSDWYTAAKMALKSKLEQKIDESDEKGLSVEALIGKHRAVSPEDVDLNTNGEICIEGKEYLDSPALADFYDWAFRQI